MPNRPIRILAIDDEPIILDLIKFNLEKDGYRVDTFSCIKDALKKNLSIYNLIITDVIINDIKSIDFISNIKQNPETTHIPIIICSIKGMEKDVTNSLNAGADDFIVKPFSTRELSARVKSMLRRQCNNASSK